MPMFIHIIRYIRDNLNSACANRDRLF